jgi:mannose-1-phosphate guanylyltransferase/phosphomannomutase
MKAMVLCAGYGTRMGGLTADVPKALLAVNGHPILAYILAQLRRHNFTQIAINLHFKPQLILDQIGDGSKWDLQLRYIHEPTLLGTAGAVKNLETFFRTEEMFLVHYGDILSDQDLSAMVQSHRERRALATLLVHRRVRSNSRVTLDDHGRITRFLERPGDGGSDSADAVWVNSGIYLLAGEVLDLVPPNTPCDWPRDVFPKLINTGRCYGFPLTGYRCAIDSPERLAEANRAAAAGELSLLPLP